jgi:hypothetical protein
MGYCFAAILPAGFLQVLNQGWKEGSMGGICGLAAAGASFGIEEERRGSERSDHGAPPKASNGGGKELRSAPPLSPTAAEDEAKVETAEVFFVDLVSGWGSNP